MGVMNEWGHSGRPPLLHFGRSGGGIVPSEALFTQRFTFSPSEQSVSISLRTKRGKEADVVQLYFTNPDWDSDNPGNFCAVEFTHNKIGQS